jgi:hypothetical protein
MCFVFVFFLGALNKDEQIANFSMIFAILIAANIVLLNRIEEKKHIFKISFIALTVIYIFFGTYNVYLEKSVSDYQFEKTDYSYTTTLADGGKVEQYCRFENGEKDKENSICAMQRGKSSAGRYRPGRAAARLQRHTRAVS